MQENLREFNKKILSALKTSYTKIIGGLIPVIMLLSAGIIARTQEEPFQVNDFTGNNEEEAEEREFSSGFFPVYESEREIPEWVKPARWFRSNSGGMPLEEKESRIAALRGQYALVIDFATSDDLPVPLLGYYNENFFIEMRALYKNGAESRVQWIFRDENYGVRLNAVLLEAAQDTESEITEAAPIGEEAASEAAVIQNTEDINTENAEENEIAGAQGDIDDKETDSEIIAAPVKKRDSVSGFIEIYDDKYHLTTEYRYSDKGDKTKIEYSYKDNIKTSAKAMLWDDDKEDYIQTHTDYYLYNRSSFLRAVERVFLMDQQITSADNVVANNDAADNGVASNGVASNGAASNGAASNGAASNIVKVSFPSNILAAAKNNFFMGEKFNAYPEFFGDLLVLKDSKLIYTTDKHGRVLEQTLINNDEEKKVIWKIENTWSDDRIVKITKTEGETVFLAEYVYNKNGDKVLERNIKNGILERVVRSEGKTDIEELYLNNKVVLQAVWEDGRKISESRIINN